MSWLLIKLTMEFPAFRSLSTTLLVVLPLHRLHRYVSHPFNWSNLYSSCFVTHLGFSLSRLLLHLHQFNLHNLYRGPKLLLLLLLPILLLLLWLRLPRLPRFLKRRSIGILPRLTHFQRFPLQWIITWKESILHWSREYLLIGRPQQLWELPSSNWLASQRYLQLKGKCFIG